ncbi:TonB-dependent receptor [Thermophagus sp. OGC60D27]|uniref:TonB-dependent receptor n=1 Tax=Thermophagus sp. OGC60D27 TaxID=3458415 RepID=UPI004037661F
MKIYFLIVFFLASGIIIFSQNPVQTVRGSVLDATTKAPLPGANVVLEETGGGTTTNMDGQFELKGVPVGRYTLQVRFIGYEPAVIPELLVGSGKEVVVNVEMEEAVSNLKEVVISSGYRKDRPVNSMAVVSARTFSVEEARRYAGALDDPGRMAGNFSGVTTAGINNNAIVVRGNAPKGLLWRLEGVDIPVPSHFSGSNVAGGGGLTMFSGQMLANSEFYTGAFPAEYGNATAGVFDMRLRNGNNQKQEFAAQVGVQGVEAAAEGPFRKKSGGSYLFNYRYSTMALIFGFLPETREGTEIPVYQDLSFKVNMPAGDLGIFSLWGIGGLSKSTSNGFDRQDKWTYPEDREKMRFEYNMGAMGVTHKKALSENTYLNSTLAVNAGQHVYSEKIRLDANDPEVLTPKLFVENVEGKLAFSSVLTSKVNSRLSMKGGVDAGNLFFDLTGDTRMPQSGDYVSFLAGEGRSWLLSANAQAKYMIVNNLFFTAGVNASWLDMNDEFRVEPRVSAAWQLHPNHRISAGYGNHSQIEPLFVYFVSRYHDETGAVIHPNQRLKRMGAHHFVLGYDWSPVKNFRIKIEPYYQMLYDVPVEAGTAYSMLNFRSDWTFDKLLVNEGSGRNMGVDVTIERFLKDGYYYMITGSVYDSQYTGGDGVERRSRYDGEYVANILGGKEWLVRGKNLLGANFKVTFMGPFWYHPVDEEATVTAGEIVYDDDLPFVDRHSSLETLTDFTLTYRINASKTSSVFAFQVKNLAGRQYQGKRFNLMSREIENEFFYSAIPFVSYKIEF